MIVGFKILEFRFMGFPPSRICLFMSKLVKGSHSTSELRCPASEHGCFYTGGSKYSEAVGCAAGILILTGSSLFL